MPNINERRRTMDKTKLRKQREPRPVRQYNILKKIDVETIFITVALLCLVVSAASGVRMDANISEIMSKGYIDYLNAQEQESDATPVTLPHSYEVVRADVSWEQARIIAEEKGGYLATITTQEEWDQVKALLDTEFGSKTAYVWLGASNNEEGSFTWITGETFEYTDWYSGEPSRVDRDGTPERYLCTWNLNGAWSWNDQRNDVLAVVPSLSGSIGMVIEYDNTVETVL